MKQWYSHLIEIESITTQLDQLNLSNDERLYLSYLIDSSLHHTILNAILSELSEEDKRVLINHLNEGDHARIWQYLKSKIVGIEDKIKKAASDLKKELHKDLKKADKL